MKDKFFDNEPEYFRVFNNGEDFSYYNSGIDPADYYWDNIDEEDYYESEAGSWPYEETFEMSEPASYMWDYISEPSEEYELDTLNDFAELAEALRETLHEDYQYAPHEEMEEALFNILETMTPAEGFNFMKALSQISKAGQKVLKDPAIGQIAKTVLPTAGTAVGTIFGGPLGAAVGGSLGQAAGQAFSGGSKPSIPSAHLTVAKTSPKAGSDAAKQLLLLTQNKDMLKALAALALGSNGRKSFPIGINGPKVEVGGLMSLLNTLAGKAAEDADELLRDSDSTPAYLLDSEGEFRVDPADPESRAQALYSTLIDRENQELADELAER
jgi:hypothetical protein